MKKENIYLSKIIITLKKTVNKIIHWVCKKFSISEEEDFIRDFQKETDTYLDPKVQLEYEEEKEKDWDFEM